MTKLKYCYSHLKSFVFMFWIVLFMFLNHLSIPHTPNPLFPSNFLLFFPNAFPKFFQILYCFIHHKPRQFRPSQLPFFFFFYYFFYTLPTSLHPECCATPFIHLFQQRNAHSHTSFFNSSHIFDSLRSASMRLSDERSLHSSIPHHTAVQPAL